MERQGQFSYDQNALNSLFTVISPQRMTKYMNEAHGDRQRAIHLYNWNSSLSEAFYFPLQSVEISLRNAMCTSIVAIFGQNWCDDHRFVRLCNDGILKSIQKAKDRIERSGKPITQDRVTAALTFDFWSSLFGSDFDRQLWQKSLKTTFPYLPRGIWIKEVRTDVHKIRAFRNRVAHYEPIITQNTSEIHSTIINIIEYICPTTALWVRHHSKVLMVMRARP